MRTPKEYSENLKRGIVTGEMMGAVLYSVNKRAKNWRDKERNYRCSFHDRYGNEEKSRNQKEQMYSRKEALLEFLKPVCIHKIFLEYERERVYSRWESDYSKLLEKCIDDGTFLKSGSFWDREIGQEVEFFDYKVESYEYRPFYECGEYSFHSKTMTEEEAEQSDLKIQDIGLLTTQGHEYTDLISVNFVDKVIDALKEGNAVLQLKA